MIDWIRNPPFFFFSFLAAVLLVPSAVAQTAVFNVPTADTLTRGSWNIEFDALAKPARNRDGGYQTLGFSVIYGLTKSTEVGMNSYQTWDSLGHSADVEFDIKQTLYRNKEHGITTATGVLTVVPLNVHGQEKTSAAVYANVGKSFGNQRGPTITGGIYHVIGGLRPYGDRTGAMVGAIQPVGHRFDVFADWLSGRNRLGYASAGWNWNITRHQYILSAWSFGNHGRGNHALAVYYGFIY